MSQIFVRRWNVVVLLRVIYCIFFAVHCPDAAAPTGQLNYPDLRITHTHTIIVGNFT